MRRERIIPLVLLSALMIASSLFAAEAAARRPNIILFLVDDMGWTDCGAYGSTYYETPNMDQLARCGMRFTDAYSANPLCSPTRASILTGKYPARHGITNPSGHLPPQPPGYQYLADTAPANQEFIFPQSKHYLEPSEYTIAERLRDAGYRTGHFGKWHLGLTEPHWPDKQGFEVAFHGKPDPGPFNYFSPYGFKYQSFADGPSGEYITDRLTDEALKFIESHRHEPFLLHLWQYGVHGPWGHKEAYTREFAKKRDPSGRQGNPIMASMLKSVDESLGRVVAKLAELKIADNTIILFSSDNGGNVISNTPKDLKNVNKNARLPPRRQALLADWRRWAGDLPPTNNAPLREGKGWLYEGGIRVPLVVVWPGRVKPDTTCSVPVCSIDFYPTVVEMAGLEPKGDQIIDGRSLTPLLDQTGKWDRPAVFNFFPQTAGNKPAGATVRAGDWKLIRWWNATNEHPEPYELYNLRDDLGETKNLARQMPDKVKELEARIDGFLKETGALIPKRNPNYNPNAVQAARRSADPLQGWVPKQCQAALAGNALRITGAGPRPFLANTQIRHAGPATLALRLRSSAGGEGKVQWRTADQQNFPASGQVVRFDLKPQGDWQQVKIPLPIEGQLVHFRLYLPLENGAVEIAEAQFIGDPSARPVRSWSFNSLK